MELSYKDLVFESNKTHDYDCDCEYDYRRKTEGIDFYQYLEDKLYDYKMELYLLPVDINLRCDNLKMFVYPQSNSNEVYFPLSRNFDIFFSVKSITNDKYIKKKELCYSNGLDKIKDVEFNTDICTPLHIYKCIKVEYDDAKNIPEKIEMIYSAGLLKHKYKNNITNIIFPY